MARYVKKKKKGTAGKIVLGLTSAVLLTGVTAGAIYAIDQNQVSASDDEKQEAGVIENETSVEELEAKIAELEASKNDLQAKLTALTSDKENLESEVSDLEKTIVDNQASIGSLTGQIETLDEEITSLRAEKLVLEENAEAHEARIAELATAIETLESEKLSLQTQLIEKENTIISLNSQVVDLQSQIANLNTQIEELNQGEYKLTIDNPVVDVREYDYSRIRDYQDYSIFNDVHSTLSGENVDYQIILSNLTYEDVNGVSVKRAYMYYFNGSADNGDYAVRVLNFDSSINDLYLGYYNNELIDSNDTIMFWNSGDVFDLNNFTAELNSNFYDDIPTIYSVTITNNSTGESVTLSYDGVTTYTFEENTEYSISATVGNSWVSFVITTKTGNIASIPSGYSLVSENWDSEGNYIVDLKNTNGDSMFIKIMKQHFINGDHFISYENLEFSDGYYHQSGTGGLGKIGFNFSDRDGNFLTMYFFEARMIEMHEYFNANFTE